MSAPDFVEFPKIGRWYRPVCITEKIDGTNASILIGDRRKDHDPDPTILYEFDREDGSHCAIRAGSRTRWLTRTTDNHGFCAWVQENAAELVKLGEGHHFGEWWGSGIQRGYGLPKGEKRFSLFNTHRWGRLRDIEYGVFDKHIVEAIKAGTATEVVRVEVPGLDVVPVLYRGPLRHNETDYSPATDAIQEAVRRLRAGGSQAAPGFMDPEGIMIYHEALRTYGKFTLDGDAHKG